MTTVPPGSSRTEAESEAAVATVAALSRSAAARLARKAERLHSNAHFQELRRTGAAAAGTYLVLRHISGADGKLRVGIVTSRRYCLEAVARNRARRLLREAWRQSKAHVQPAWVVLLPRQPMKRAHLPQVLADLVRQVKRAGLWQETSPDAPA